jgi:pimeloyl-ACP methyl ester carboxylesterase
MLAGNPTELSVFVWSHGYGRLLRDQVDATHARTQGARLAAKIQERQKCEPGRRVVIIAHSAGCAVALAAGDVLPPDSIDRMILLAPSVSTGYDIRPSLRSAREGVDVFCSKKDWLALGFVTRVVGTTDKYLAPAAGRHGFRMNTPDPEVTRLRQHFWTAELTWTGHTGGHYGVHAPGFIHAYLFPAMGVPAPSDGPRMTTVRTEYRPTK